MISAGKVALQYLTFPEVQMPILFSSGQIVATPAAIAFMEENNVTPQYFLGRHLTGDDGDLCKDDKNLNRLAITTEDRVFSSYNVGQGTVWVITEWDRSYTTILLPEDY